MLHIRLGFARVSHIAVSTSVDQTPLTLAGNSGRKRAAITTRATGCQGARAVSTRNDRFGVDPLRS